MQPTSYQAIVIVSFGGPEKREDVLPFLENVVRGRNVSRERLLEVAEHYYDLGGVSPINAQNRQLAESLTGELAGAGLDLPVYLGNRNWHPFLAETLREMADSGIRRALGFVTSAFSSYSGCRQYLDNIADARHEVGPDAPEVDKIRAFFNHPGFIEAAVASVSWARREIPSDTRAAARLIFTAHSIPLAVASQCEYVNQLRESCRLVAAEVGHEDWDLVYQSRSGPPSQPWLEPDICDHLRHLSETAELRNVIVMPIGFLTDHVEVLHDLDTEAYDVAESVGLNMIRAPAVGAHPRITQMIRELIVERLTPGSNRSICGTLGPSHDVCPADCCPSGRPTPKPD